ncbi:MAG: hypothetical protein ACK5R5_02915 [Alphaproteobacteria bacterium]
MNAANDRPAVGRLFAYPLGDGAGVRGAWCHGADVDVRIFTVQPQ